MEFDAVTQEQPLTDQQAIPATPREQELLDVMGELMTGLENVAGHLEVRGQHQSTPINGHFPGRCETCSHVRSAGERIDEARAKIDNLFGVGDEAEVDATPTSASERA